MKRRQFLTRAGLLSLVGTLIPGRLIDSALGEPAPAPAMPDGSLNVRLGLRPVINAMGTVTFLGGSIMAPETLNAMTANSREFVVISELLEKSGEHLARLIGVEAALITTGAAGAITLGTAACIAGADPDRIRQLPDVTGLRHEVVLQQAHRNEYETQLRLPGGKLIRVETVAELEAAINKRTAMLFFMNKAAPLGKISREEWIAAGRRHGIPTFLDAAADTPPPVHLSSYVGLGFDLVAFSGGKALRGPQSTGLLLGRKDLVDAARHHASPYDLTVGRAMKVGKEEIAGLVDAVERFLRTDHAAEFAGFEARVRRLESALSGLSHVQAELWVPEIANHVPHLIVRWDSAGLHLTSSDIYRSLLAGEPRVAVRELGPNAIVISVQTLQPNEDAIVASRLRTVLGG